VRKSCIKIFNELIDAAMVGGSSILTKQQKEQIILLIKRFNETWSGRDDKLSFPGLLTLWNQQYRGTKGRAREVVQPERLLSGVESTVEAVKRGAENLIAMAVAEKEKILGVVVQSREEARVKKMKEEKETEETKKQKAELERKLAMQRGLALAAPSKPQLAQPVHPGLLARAEEQRVAIPVAAPVAEDPAVAKKISELKKILQNYKRALAETLRSRVSGEDKNKLHEQMVNLRQEMVKAFTSSRRDLAKALKGRSLSEQQNKELKDLDDVYGAAIDAKLD